MPAPQSSPIHPANPLHTAVIRMQEIDSTSAYARREAAEGRLCLHPIVFVARRQTSGVGRFGRTWSSPIGGLWMTLTWSVPTGGAGVGVGAGVGAEMLDGLGLRLGVACRQSVARLLSEAGVQKSVLLKWPNDVLIDGRKVLGVLTELVARGEQRWVLVGIGLNANFAVEDLPEKLAGTSTTMRVHTGRDIDLSTAERTITSAVTGALQKSGVDAASLADAREHLYGIGQRTRVSLPDGSHVTGDLQELDDQGRAVFSVDGKPYTPPLGSVLMLA